MALYNCAYSEIGDQHQFIEDICWIMDSLMYGTGVGFQPVENNKLDMVEPWTTYKFVIPDTREGWVDALRRLLQAFIVGSAHEGQLPDFDFSIVRPEGSPIKTFGGTASGSGPLQYLLKIVEERCYRYISDNAYTIEMFKTDIANLVGVCVVTGNLRRSAEIAIAPIGVENFLDLKNYEKYPYRESWGWMSNNSVTLESDDDFERLGEIATRIIKNGEPGILNWKNFPKGRLNGKNDCPVDIARGINPCGEIPLENKEVCNVVETLPTRCADLDTWLDACEYATFYASTVALLPTHQPTTNAVIARNRRIGVSIVDFTGWVHEQGTHKVISALRQGYTTIRKYNKELADEAGVPSSIRVTTSKPGGTVPKIAGRTAGIGYPTFRWTITRVRVQRGTPFERVLIDAGVPHEPDAYSLQTNVFEFPVEYGPAVPATEVTLWQQAANLMLMQREWADNAVSNTLYFKPMWDLVYDGPHALVKDHPIWSLWRDVMRGHSQRPPDGLIVMFKEEWKFTLNGSNIKIWKFNSNHEENQIEAVLAFLMPHVKSLSMLPHTAVGVYKQMPQEGISFDEYQKRLGAIQKINWKNFGDSDGSDEKYCQGGVCSLPTN
jgi:ribonucleoside-diphosphate reductase alpha chain